jgi:membrane protein required for colicin V production
LVTFKFQIDPLNYFDLIVGIGLLYGVVKGFSRGLIVEMASIIAFVLGVWGALRFADQLLEYVSPYVTLPEGYGKLIIYIVLFIGIVFGVSWVAKITTKVLKVIALGLLNRLAGALFGLCKWGLIFSLLVLVFLEINTVFTLLPEETLNSSFFYPTLKQLGTWVFDWAMIQNVDSTMNQITML